MIHVTGRSSGLRKARSMTASLPGNALEVLETRRLLSFAAPVSYVVGTQNSKELNGFGPQVITGDFNTDGKLDLAVTNPTDGTLSILDGNGNGTFQAAATYSTGLGSNGPVWLAAADFNGDGKPDLAIEGGNSVSILLNNGNGTFGTPKVYATGTGVRGGVVVADFFGNGKLDVAIVAFGTNNIQILPGNGTGTFGTPVVVAMPASFHNIRSIVSGDFFGNGRPDIAIAGNEGYNNVLSSSDPAGVALFKNDGKGNFTYQAQYASAVTPDPGGGNGTGDTVNPEHVNAADLNGDGKLDLVVSLYDHNIDVYINNGDGTFQPAVAYTTETPGSLGGYPRGVAFGDFNGDGKIDIVSLNFGEPVPADQPTPQPGSIGILYGNGDGTFQAPIQYTPYLLPGSVVAADFNGDGLPDLAVTQNYTGHVVGVMLNQPNTAQEPPTVTGVSPAAGLTSGGNTVTISGTNFLGTTQVNFGTVPAKSFSVISGTTITAAAPAEAVGAVDVSVYNAGASAVTSADQYLYEASLTSETWTGLGATNNWSDGANWSGKLAPGASTTVVFNGTSTKNAVIDAGFGGVVAAVAINGGYTGTITQNEPLAVSTTFTENAGVYSANGFATTVTGLTTLAGGTYFGSTSPQTFTGGLTISGGTLTGSSGAITAGNLTFWSGTLNAPSTTLTVNGGNTLITGGTFNADGGTFQYTGSFVSPTMTVSVPTAFNNFTDALVGPYPTGITIAGTLTTNGVFKWLLGSGIINGNIEARGDVDDQNHGGTGTPYFTLDGTGNQTIEDTSSGGTGGLMRTLTINKASGAVVLACNPLDFGNFTLTAGTVNSGAYSLAVGGQGPLSMAPGLNAGNLQVNGSNVTVSSTSFQVNNLTFFAAGDKLTAPTGTLSLTGSWNNAVGATFVPNGGTVVFDGTTATQQLTSGGQAFNNLTVNAGAVVKLDDNLTVNGVFINNGTVIPFAPPTVKSVAPNAGPAAGGTVVTITGTNFYGTTQVDFGTVAAKSFTVLSNTSLTATAPAHSSGLADVTVFNSTASALSSADQFTYAAGLSPVVTGIAPAFGSTDGGTVVTITGTNFTSDATVKFGNDFAISVTVNSATSITATSPGEVPGAVDLTVVESAGTSPTGSSDTFTFQTPQLAKITLTPAALTLADGGSQTFVATGVDQFGQPLSAQPTWTWSLTGRGSVAQTGLYNAPGSGVGAAAVKAASGSISATASVTIKAHPANDFLGVGATTPVIFRRVNPGLIDWFIKGDASLTGSGHPFGAGSLDVPLTGDFNGDGAPDLAIYRPSSGQWYVQDSGPSKYASTLLATFGAPNLDLPVPGDYNGTGTTIPAVYRPTTGQWILYAGGAGKNITLPVTFPTNAVPVPGDYDNVGKTEAAVYNPATSQWLVETPGASTYHVVATFGATTDIPVPGAYDALTTGNLAVEAAVWRPSTGQYFIHGLGGTRIIQFAVGDIPAPGDYDGIGATEAAVYRPSTGQWLVMSPSASSPRVLTSYGGLADVPTLSPYRFRALSGGGGASSIGAPIPVFLGSSTPTPSPTAVSTHATSAKPHHHRPIEHFSIRHHPLTRRLHVAQGERAAKRHIIGIVSGGRRPG